jgi:hypothetical protein
MAQRLLSLWQQILTSHEKGAAMTDTPSVLILGIGNL